MMQQCSRIPAFPVGSPQQLRTDLVAQILDFQSGYRFSGPRLARDTLERLPTRKLEKLCDMMLMAIANSLVMSVHHGPKALV